MKLLKESKIVTYEREQWLQSSTRLEKQARFTDQRQNSLEFCQVFLTHLGYMGIHCSQDL